jgi:tetratricopeptide (TPR) repeat protein
MRIVCCLFFLFVFLNSVVAQQPFSVSPVDIEHYEISVEIIPEESLLRGQVKTSLVVLQDSASLPFEINSRLTLFEVTDEEGGRYSISFDDFDSTNLRIRGSKPFRQGEEKTFIFEFEGILEREQHSFLDIRQNERAAIHRKGALLLSEGLWFPSHRLTLDAASTEIRVVVPLGFSVVAPGELTSIKTVGVGEAFTWESRQPLTEIQVVMSRFFRRKFSDLKFPVTFFVTEDFSQNPRPLAEEVVQMLDFFQSEYGEPSWSELNIVQVENVELPSTGCAGLTLLEPEILQQPSSSRMELARRIARQWWGCSVQFAGPSDAWLADGFAAYAALRYFQVKYPEEFPAQLAYQAVQALKYENQAPIRRGLELGVGSDEYKSVVSAKGAWVLYMLSHVIGNGKFNTILREWYREKSAQAAVTEEWIAFLQARTGVDYRWFFVQWIDQVGVPQFQVDYTTYKLRNGGFKIRGQVKQDLEIFRMPLDLIIETKGENEKKQLNINGKTNPFTFLTETMPVSIRLDPKGKILKRSREIQVEIYIALGEEYRLEGEFIPAIREYERATEMSPRRSLGHFRLGELFFDQQNLSSAANSFRESLNGDLKPIWVEAWAHIYLGKVYDVLGQRQRALAEYQKAINTKNDYNGAQFEAEKYTQSPFAKPSNLIGLEEK